MPTKNLLLLLLANCLLFTSAAVAQTANFDETWKEFLDNNKISNMSTLMRPERAYKPLDYAKYLLMNANTNFCQSEVADAEKLIEEIEAMDNEIPQAIPGYVGKLQDISAKIKASHSMDLLWQRFLGGEEIPPSELEAVEAAQSSCEKETLAKYSYMSAYYHLCHGDVAKSKDIFQNRTLRLAEKTSLRIQDVEGLAEQVRKMKQLYIDMDRLDLAWANYLRTGNARGFEGELPLFSCYPIPKMKEFVLKGAVDPCTTTPVYLGKLKDLQAKTGVTPTDELATEIDKLTGLLAADDQRVAALEEAWAAFIPDNKVKHMGRYGYEYCETEPLVKAYLMDGFAYVCELGSEMLLKVDSLRRATNVSLDKVTLSKINDLETLNREFQANGRKIERLWHSFVGNGDRLQQPYESEDYYCDNIHQVKDWTMQGLSASCEVCHLYLDEIEAFQARFEFNFTPDLECRVQMLRVKVWDCRNTALDKLARLEAPEDPAARLEALRQEYGMSERPEECDKTR
ncbi:MAG: hypothetical protein AAGJ82_12805 [Bacteroidota bacterium]